MSLPLMRGAAQRGGARFQQRAHLVEVEQVVAIEAADDRAAVGLDLDQALAPRAAAAPRGSACATCRSAARAPPPAAAHPASSSPSRIASSSRSRTRGAAILHTKSRLDGLRKHERAGLHAISRRCRGGDRSSSGCVPAAEQARGSGPAAGAGESRSDRAPARERAGPPPRAGSAATSGPCPPVCSPRSGGCSGWRARTPPSSPVAGGSTPPAVGLSLVAAAEAPPRLVGAALGRGGLGRERVGGGGRRRRPVTVVDVPTVHAPRPCERPQPAQPGGLEPRDALDADVEPLGDARPRPRWPLAHAGPEAEDAPLAPGRGRRGSRSPARPSGAGAAPA